MSDAKLERLSALLEGLAPVVTLGLLTQRRLQGVPHSRQVTPSRLICAQVLLMGPVATGAGLFNGLADPRIARALVAMHQRPSFDWNLELLAHEAVMSRTAFSTKFHEVMRRPPGKYWSAIRLALAQRAVDLGQGLKEAARVAGYENSSALSRAMAKARLQSATN